MIADKGRMDAYAAALRSHVRPGSIVLDIGTGTGIFALIAARLGARKVYALETEPAIQIARETARNNGLQDRIEFIQKDSTKVSLPERADVIVSDIRGVLPVFRSHIPTIIDARERHLKPGGALIPSQDFLQASLIEAPDEYGRLVDAWNSSYLEIDLKPGHRYVVNTWSKLTARPDQLLTVPERLGEIVYSSVSRANLDGEVSLELSRRGVAHGAIVWFDTELADGIGFSNAPGKPEHIYGQAFFPFPSPVSVETGDSFTFRLRADLVGEEYVWRWDSEHVPHVKSGTGHETTRFEQSTLKGTAISAQSVKRRADRFVPERSESAQVDAFLLNSIDGQASLGEIATKTMQNYPDAFSDWHAALTRAGELAERYNA